MGSAFLYTIMQPARRSCMTHNQALPTTAAKIIHIQSDCVWYYVK
jgi:hypothetical protein